MARWLCPLKTTPLLCPLECEEVGDRRPQVNPVSPPDIGIRPWQVAHLSDGCNEAYCMECPLALYEGMTTVAAISWGLTVLYCGCPCHAELGLRGTLFYSSSTT